MKKISLLIITISLCCELAFAQVAPPPPPPPPSGIESTADKLKNEGDIPGAIAEYRKTYSTDPENKKNIYNYASALSLGQQTDSCLKYLNIAVTSDTSSIALTDPNLLSVREDKGWIMFENKLIMMLNKKQKNSIQDIEYAKALWRLKTLDQAYFYETGIAIRKLGPASPVVTALRRLKEITNANNRKELEMLISANGWPMISKVGSEAAGTAFYIVQHSDPVTQQKFLPMLEQRCRENEADWFHYAMLYDRMKVNMNLPQKYGTQPLLDNRRTGKYELAPLEDETKVNEWRKEVGLEPLKQFPVKFQ